MLPFSYFWSIKKNIEKSAVKTILELGCGDGAFGDVINKNNEYQITGVDIFEPYLKKWKQKGKYTTLIKKDLTKKLNIKAKSFDAVVCLQVIEHLNKKTGQELIEQMEKIAKKLVIITSPNGTCLQEEYDQNKYQRHLSSWDVIDFKKRGYRVSGRGLKIIYGEHSHATEGLNLIKLPLYFISFLANPYTDLNPNVAAQLIAIKKIK